MQQLLFPFRRAVGGMFNELFADLYGSGIIMNGAAVDVDARNDEDSIIISNLPGDFGIGVISVTQNF